MRSLHARYPFLSSARDTVAAADVDLATVVDAGDPAVERAVERVVGAVEDGAVGEAHRDVRTELLSYPIARVLVSLIDQPALTRRYAGAEAEAAHRRFTEELSADAPELRSVETDQLTLDALLSEFELVDDIHERPEGFAVAVVAYLQHAARLRDDEWRLVNRDLSDGRVPVSRPELFRLLQQAVERRVEAGLPLSVPDAIADPLADEVAEIEGVLDELDLTREIDTVVPELFPPCMQALLDQIQQGEHLEHHSRFAITSFLTSIGLTTDEIVDLYSINPGFGEQMTRYQTDHIRGDSGPTDYTPPSCATMQSYGDCVNKDDLCDAISHPLSYYEVKLDDAEEDELEDWREREEGEA